MHRVIRTFIAITGAALLAPHLPAQPDGGPPAGKWLNRVTVGGIHQFEAGLDAGGDIGLSRLSAEYDGMMFLKDDRSFGMALDYIADDYSFSGDTGLGGNPPWGNVRELSASVFYATPIGSDWMLRIAPTLRSAGEASASTSDTYIFGGVIAATKEISETLTLGLGAGIFTGLAETRGYPFIAINWKFAENWALRNPFRPGPAGPAGLEISYTAGSWEFGFGGAYRSYRFRLDKQGDLPNGIGEYNAVPLFLRATYTFAPFLTADVYAGGIVGGSIELEDSDGNDLIRSDYDLAPLVALSITGRF